MHIWQNNRSRIIAHSDAPMNVASIDCQCKCLHTFSILFIHFKIWITHLVFGRLLVFMPGNTFHWNWFSRLWHSVTHWYAVYSKFECVCRLWFCMVDTKNLLRSKLGRYLKNWQQWCGWLFSTSRFYKIKVTQSLLQRRN